MTNDKRIIRVFPKRTSMTPEDSMAFVGPPPLFRPMADLVHLSVTFTWDIAEAKKLAAAWSCYYPVKFGGPALASPANGFHPGLYVKTGVTFTSRGCNNNCPWCLVPKREGRLREVEISSGNIVQDNNLLQCSQGHIEKVFGMLRSQRHIQLSGGLDTQLITDEIADQIRGLRISQLFLACDTKSAIGSLRRAVKKLQMPRDKVRCYVLIAFNGETISEATERMEEVYNAGCLPFAQLYQPPDKYINYSHEWRSLARTWSRPAAMRTVMKKMIK